MALLLLLAACGGNDGAWGNPPPEQPPEAEFKVSIPAFERDGPIPERYTCVGENISPEITWTDVPVVTGSFALAMYDPDAPRGVFDHWVLFNLPPHLEGIPEGVPSDAELIGGGVHGRNSYGDPGYLGPCPSGQDPHRYRFTVFALDQMLLLDSSADKQALFNALTGHILGNDRYEGTYPLRLE